MPSRPPERRAIGYMSPERRLEVYWRRKRQELRSMVASWPSLYAFLPSTRSLRTPSYRVLALLIKRMLTVKRIFSCCRVLQAHALNNQFLRYSQCWTLINRNKKAIHCLMALSKVYCNDKVFHYHVYSMCDARSTCAPGDADITRN